MKLTRIYSSITNTAVHVDIYQPNVILRYKGIIQIHHGISEYSSRYKKFAEYLSHEGFIVVVPDFPGHGTSLHEFEQGYFGDGKALDTLVEDMQRLSQIVSSNYEDLPYFMIGIDFGSLVLMKYMQKYGDYIHGAIMIGTCIKNPFYYKLLTSVKVNTFLYGNMYRSKFNKKIIDNILQGNIKDNYKTNNLNEWKQYLDDPMTDFIYTNQAYLDMLDYIKYVDNDVNLKKIPNYLPIYLLSGGLDNLTRKGKDTLTLYNRLKNNGVKDLEYKIYPDKKQDILHENEYEKIYKDIMKWLDARTYI